MCYSKLRDDDWRRFQDSYDPNRGHAGEAADLGHGRTGAIPHHHLNVSLYVFSSVLFLDVACDRWRTLGGGASPLHTCFVVLRKISGNGQILFFGIFLSS